MSLVICAFVLLVVSGLYTSVVAGAAAIMLSGETFDTTASIYDESSFDYEIDNAITKTTTITTDVEITQSFYQPSFSDLKPMLARADSFMGEKMSSSGSTMDEYLSAPTKAARVFRRRSTVFYQDTGLLFLRC